MTFNFEDAKPVKVTGGGVKASENPFTDVVKSIALKTGDDNKPLAKAFVATYDEKSETDKKATVVNRIKRQMSEAGQASTPPVTVRVHTEDAKDEKGKVIPNSVRVIFWTVKRQERPRPAQTASTPQSTAPAAPTE